MNLGDNSVGGIDVVLRDVFPNLVEICERIRMESVADHPPERRRSLFSRSFLNDALNGPIDGRTQHAFID